MPSHSDHLLSAGVSGEREEMVEHRYPVTALQSELRCVRSDPLGNDPRILENVVENLDRYLRDAARIDVVGE
jgi:hypothetical protein